MKNNKYTGQIALFALFGMLVLFAACSNILHPAPSQTVNNFNNPEAAMLTIVVSPSPSRTVFPDAAADIASYRLFDTRAGEASEQLAEFTETEKTVSLAVGTWNFLLNAYNASGEMILQGEAKDIELGEGGANRVTIDIAPLMGGEGDIEITINFPESVGITRIEVTGDLGTQNFNIESGDHSFIWTKSGVPSAYYFASFTLYSGSGKASVISEIIQVSKDLTSRKTIKLSGSDLKAELFTQPEGTTLAAKLAWLKTNAVSGGNYLLYVNADESIAPTTLHYEGKSGISVSLLGAEQTRTITNSSYGSILTVGSGVTLLLENNVTLKGRGNYTNNAALVSVKNGGVLVINDGAVITGNVNDSPSNGRYGGGVNIEGGGTFTMNGGEISNNSVIASVEEEGAFGGGVYVGGRANFTMNGGKISGNSAEDTYVDLDISRRSSTGGGVFVGSGSGYNFTINGGEIINNSATSEAARAEVYGGGVYAVVDNFTINGGKISGNSASADPFTFDFNSFSEVQGGGVWFASDNFIMNGGEITNNSVSVTGYNKGPFGGASHGGRAHGGGLYGRQYSIIMGLQYFTINGGIISGNSVSASSFSNYSDASSDDSTAGWAEALGGGVYTEDLEVTINGGEISNNSVSSFRDYSNASHPGNSAGGGIFVGVAYSFVKTGGTITGYDDDTVNGNVVKGKNGVIINNQGHAVVVSFYSYYSNPDGKVYARKECSAGTEADLFYGYINDNLGSLSSGDNSSHIWSGEWDYKYEDENDLTLGYWNNDYLPTSDALLYSFNVLDGITYYLWLNDGKEGDGTKTLDVTLDAYGYVNFHNVDSAWDTPYTFTPSQSGKITISVAAVNAGETGNYAIMVTNNNYPNTVTFNKNGGDTEASPRTIELVKPAMNVSVLPTPPEKAGFTFTGWNTRPDGSGNSFNSWNEVTSSITVYATYNHVEELIADTYYEGSMDAEEVQWFKFNATSSKQYINISFGTLTDVSLALFDGNFEWVVSLREEEEGVYSISANPGVVYYLRVYPLFDDDGGTYGLTVSDHIVRGRQLSADTWAEGNISTQGGEQWFTFTATSDTKFIHASFGTLTGIIMQVYDSNRNTVGSVIGNTISISRSVTSGQMYYIRVAPSSSNGNGTYKIVFTTSVLPPGVSSTELTFDTWADGNITTGSGEQWFHFTAAADVQHIRVDSETFLFHPYVRVYDSNGSLVGSCIYTLSTDSLTLTVTNGAVYYIKVTSHDNFTAGTYKIRTLLTSPVPPELSLTQLDIDKWAEGYIPTNGEQWFTFIATADTQFIHARFDSLDYITVQIYDGNGKGNTDVTGWTLSDSRRYLSTSVTNGEQYYIKVADYVDMGAPYGNYYIAFNTSETPPEIPSIQLAPDTWASAIIPALYEEQWFSFTATAETQYIHASFGTLTNIYVQLYDSNGNAVGDRANLDGNNRYISLLVTNEMFYSIKVTPYSSSYSGTYQIGITTTALPPEFSSIQLTPLEADTWADGDLPSSSAEQWFSFTATADTQYIHFLPTGLYRIYMQLYNSNGNTLGERTDLDNDFHKYISLPVTSGQVYYINVTTNQYNGGLYKIGFNTSPAILPGIKLEADTWADGNLPSSNATQWFSFTATADEQFIHVSFGTLTYMSVRLYDSNGDTVGDIGNLFPSSRYISQPVSSGAVYYIKVTPYSNSYSGTYKIGVTTTALPPEFSSIQLTPLEAVTWADGYIPTSSEEQWFSFTATAAAQFIHVSFVTLTNMSVQLYESNGNTVGNMTNLHSSTYSISQPVTSGNEYYIRVMPYSSSHSGTYRITFNTSPVTPGLSATDLALDTWADGDISAESREQWFIFNVAAQSWRNIHASFGSLTSINVQLYDINGSTDGYRTISSSGVRFISMLLNSGTYYIRVFCNPTSEGTYQLAISSSSTPPP